MSMKRFRQRFLNLRGKLILSYILVVTATFTLLEIFVIALLKIFVIGGALAIAHLESFSEQLLISTVVLPIFVTIVGLPLSYLMARSLTRRLKELSVVANHWSRGDFSVLIRDTSQDELGQAMRQLNLMAEQLQQLGQTRQRLTTLEAHNHLARDLHDSVKQQIFAATMQIGATRLLLQQNPAAATGALNEVENLIRQAQQELTILTQSLFGK